MIITKFASVHIKKYKTVLIGLNYNIEELKNQEYIDIPVDSLKENSMCNIEVLCDVCKITSKIIPYRSYQKNFKKYKIYACSNKCATTKNERTNLELFGVTNVSKNEMIKNKKVETFKKNYGVDQGFLSASIKEKIVKTFNLKYNANNPFYNTDIKEKIKNTILKKYGVDNPFKSSIIKDKIKETLLKKYGVDNPTKSEFIREKSRITCLIKYGFDSPMKNKDVYSKYIKNSFSIKNYNDLSYQSTYELDFLQFCYDNNIIIENGKSLEYLFNNKERVYYPDFYYKPLNLIVEIKSTYIYNLHLEQNLIKAQTCIDKGYNFIFIIDKQYDEFKQHVNSAIVH